MKNLRITWHPSTRCKTAVVFNLVDKKDVLACGILYHRKGKAGFISKRFEPYDPENGWTAHDMDKSWKESEILINEKFGWFKIPKEQDFDEDRFNEVMKDAIFESFKKHSEEHLSYTTFWNEFVHWTVVQYCEDENMMDDLLDTKYGDSEKAKKKAEDRVKYLHKTYCFRKGQVEE